MTKIFIKPKEGLKVVKPETGLPLAAKGEEVLQSTYWLRRLADGDVLLIEEKQSKLETAKSEKSK